MTDYYEASLHHGCGCHSKADENGEMKKDKLCADHAPSPVDIKPGAVTGLHERIAELEAALREVKKRARDWRATDGHESWCAAKGRCTFCDPIDDIEEVIDPVLVAIEDEESVFIGLGGERDEWCARCGRHIRNHYGGTEYRCKPREEQKHCTSCSMPASNGSLYADGDALKCGACLRAESRTNAIRAEHYLESANAARAERDQLAERLAECEASSASMRAGLNAIASWDPPGSDSAANWLSMTCRKACSSDAGAALLRERDTMRAELAGALKEIDRLADVLSKRDALILEQADVIASGQAPRTADPKGTP